MSGIKNVAIGVPKIPSPPLEKKEEKTEDKPVKEKASSSIVTRATAKSEKRKMEKSDLAKTNDASSKLPDTGGSSAKKAKVVQEAPNVKSNASQKDKPGSSEKEPKKRTADVTEKSDKTSEPAKKKSKRSGKKKSCSSSSSGSSGSDSDYDTATKVYINQQKRQAYSAKSHYDAIKKAEAKRLAEVQRKAAKESAAEKNRGTSLQQVIKKNKDVLKEKRRLTQEKVQEEKEKESIKQSPKREFRDESKGRQSQSRSSNQPQPSSSKSSSSFGTSGIHVNIDLLLTQLYLDYRPAYNHGNRGESKPCGSKPKPSSPVRVKDRQRLTCEKVSKERTSTYSSANSSNEHEP